MKWTYPLETDEFAQYQEKLLGRDLNDNEIDMTIMAVDIINKAYEDGKAGFTTGLYPRDPDECLNGMAHDSSMCPVACRYMLALVFLSSEAWEHGRKDAERLESVQTQRSACSQAKAYGGQAILN
jgi:hypothetical protein